MDTPNRLDILKDQDKITGLDFVHVKKEPSDLDGKWEISLNLYFHHSYPGRVINNGNEEQRKFADKILVNLESENISIKSLTNPKAPNVLITKRDWIEVEKNRILPVNVEIEKKYSFDEYEITIKHINIDLYFSSIRVNFQAACERHVDCKPLAHECPPEEMVDFPVDYIARDFSSFKRALLDFASL